jgi:hypothetical protein
MLQCLKAFGISSFVKLHLLIKNYVTTPLCGVVDVFIVWMQNLENVMCGFTVNANAIGGRKGIAFDNGSFHIFFIVLAEGRRRQEAITCSAWRTRRVDIYSEKLGELSENIG